MKKFLSLSLCWLRVVQEIIELTGLSIDDIEKLKNDMHVEKQA